MRPLSRNRRIAVVCAACASIVPGTTALLSREQIAGFSQGHHFLNGLLLGLSISLIGASIVFLRRDSSACSRDQTPEA
jgi:hypothetical protein